MATNKTDSMDKLKGVSNDVLKALGDRAISSVGDKVSGATDKLEGIADGGPVGKAVAKGGKAAAEGKSPAKGAVKGALSGVKDKITGGGGGGGESTGGGNPTKSTNIVESIDVGVPVSVAYNQWTEFGAFPSFMKKVESAEAEDEATINFKAQIFLSHRSWEATVMSQIPDERIVWKSKGQKGHVDGAVTFHELGPNLTRILLVLEYYPRGFFEKTGNIWEAQGRRARAEFRHFRRHVMTRTLLDPEEAEGWRGTIEDGEVVETHEDALDREERERAEQESADEDYQDEPADEADSEEAEDELPEDDYEAEPAEEAPEDEEVPEDEYVDEEAPEEEYADDEVPEEEYVDEEAPEEEPPEDELPEDEAEEDEADEADEEPAKPRRRRRTK